ncbi:hypothetical protein NMG60_11032564 [Bertholletia excelsa]
MDVGVESSEAGWDAAVAVEFPAGDETPSLPSSPLSPARMPPRLQRKLSDIRKSPWTMEEIESRLRSADLRRQMFYESLSFKARPKPRSPSTTSSNEEDLGQRLEAKLQAAEQKRLGILTKAQMRLAKLDELRQAAKAELDMRSKKECEELGTKVESRVQQAEANRMLILAKAQMRLAKLDELRQAAKAEVEMRSKKECEELGTKVESRVQQAEANRMLILAKAQMRLAKLDELRQAAKAEVEMRSRKECEELGTKVELRIQQAEANRMLILAKAQIRLAKLDELRQSAKAEVEMRLKKQREDLGTKVESRVQQAEANRMLILKAHRQRSAKLKERASQSLLRKIAQENKYKEFVRVASFQKRAAAEKKRIGLLEAEKKRAHARTLQVQNVAKSVYSQRETERKNRKDKLEDKLRRAKRHRAEYLSQRGKLRNLDRVDSNMTKQADRLSTKLARCWRQFHRQKKTTLDLAKAYDTLNINERHVKDMPFDQLALLIESSTTLNAVKALLERIENRYKLLKPVVVVATNSSCWNDIDHLLNRVASPNKRVTPRKPFWSNDAKGQVSMREAAKTMKLSRYQARVVLCAYMIVGHPDAVLSSKGEREIDLAEYAEKFVQEFELLIKIILEGPTQTSDKEADSALEGRKTFRSQLKAFDAAWCSYLNSFVLWKVKDAESLEKDLVRAACQLELSMIQTCRMTPDGDGCALSQDMKAIQKQVCEDLKLLRERVHNLSGDAGVEHMDSALSDTRMKYFQSKQNGIPVGSPVLHILFPISPTSPASPSISMSDDNTSESNLSPIPVVHSLFKDDFVLPSKEVGSSSSSSSLGSQCENSGEKLALENELIVNEVLHGQHHAFVSSSNVEAEDYISVKSKIKETLEKAFWHGIADAVNQDKPNYDRAVELTREVRDELCEMAPQSWKEEIFEAIDVDILSQVLHSGKLDMDYLGKVLEFALITLQKLSAPANEDEEKIVHQKLLRELAEICQAGDGSNHSHAIALIKGLRFVLEQIQELKQEVSKARIKIMEPLLRGPAGLDYLKNAFANHYGPPSDAFTSLSSTVKWISSVWGYEDQEWIEHRKALLELRRTHESSSQMLLPTTTLRTGRSFSEKIKGSSKNATSTEDNRHSECKGEKVDLLVRLGILKLVNRISGLTQEALPETLKLNLARLRAVQAQLQMVIVISTSILVLQQILVSERIVSNAADMESIVFSCTMQLSELLDHQVDAGIEEIVEILSVFAEDDNSSDNTSVLQSRKNVMSRMIRKSLQAGDPVFLRISHAIYLAVRGVVLGGSGSTGRELAVMALRQVGAAMLLDQVMEAAAVVLVMAEVSCHVHGPWYEHLIEEM